MFVFDGTRISAARLKAGLTQEQLADMLQCARSMVSRWESSQVEPSFGNFCRLASALGVGLNYLAGLDDRPINDPLIGRIVFILQGLTSKQRHNVLVILDAVAKVAAINNTKSEPPKTQVDILS